MKNAKIIVVLALLALSLSGCANADYSEVSAPSSQKTVTAEPVQSTVPQEITTVSVSGSTGSFEGVRCGEGEHADTAVHTSKNGYGCPLVVPIVPYPAGALACGTIPMP